MRPSKSLTAVTSRVTTSGAAAALLLAMIAAWSLGMPLMSSPDEPSHVVKAAAVVRGQLGGELGAAPVDGTEPGAPTYVDVPSDITDSEDLACYRFTDEVPADCQPDLEARQPGLVPAKTYAGQYPPLYYVLVGWPSLILQGEPAVYAMRLVSGLLCGAMVLWGVRTLARGTGRGDAIWASAVALTPMCLFIFGSVNPNGLEIAAGFAFWAACLELGRRATVRTSVVVQAAVAGSVLVLVRTSGPVWALLIAAVCLLAARPEALRALGRARSVWWAGAAAVAASAAAVAWIVTHQDIVTTTGLYPQFSAPRLVVAVMLLATPSFLEQMIGDYGWLDTPSPFPTTQAWSAVTATVVLIALAMPGFRRRRAALVALLALVVAVPIALSIPTAEAAGIIWQGRYVLPLAVGVPLLAVPLLATASRPTALLWRRMAVFMIALLAIGHVFAFYWAARRYAVGAEGVWLTLHPDWSSPIGFLPAVALYTLLVAALAAVAIRTITGAQPDAPNESDDPAAAAAPVEGDTVRVRDTEPTGTVPAA